MPEWDSELAAATLLYIAACLMADGTFTVEAGELSTAAFDERAESEEEFRSALKDILEWSPDICNDEVRQILSGELTWMQQVTA